MLSLVEIMSNEVETKSKIFKGKLWTSATHENVDQSEVCMLAN